MLKLQRRTFQRALAAVIALAAASNFDADAQRSESEREVLARAVAELELIDDVLADAERRADVSARLYFDYDHLRAELAEVRGGISDYVGGGRAQPRDLKPLSANYTRIVSEE